MRPMPIPSLLRLTVASLALLCGAGAAMAQLSQPVLLPGGAAPAPSAGVQAAADIARGGNQYLVVWEDSRSGLTGTVSTGGTAVGPSDILAARLDANGKLVDPVPIPISIRPFNQTRTKVAWNGSNWLVVWESSRATQYSTTRGIYAARVSPAGAVLDDPPIVIDDTDDVNEMFPVVASDGNRWVVLWDDLDASKTKSTINSAIVDPNGFVLAKKTLFSNSVGFMLPTNVRIAFAQDRYLFTSEHYGGGFSWDIFGQLYDGNLNPIGGEFPIDVSGSDTVHSWVASSGSGFYVAWAVDWSWSEVRGTPVSLGGAVAVPNGVQLAALGQVGDFQPRVAWDGAQWVVAVDRYGFSGSSRVEAYRVDAGGQPLAGSPIVIETGDVIDSVVAAGAAGAGSAVFAWSDSRFAYSDLFAAELSASGAVTAPAAVTSSGPAQVRPDIAGSLTGGWLVVFQEMTSGQNRILAQRLDAIGAPLDPQPFELASGDATILGPRVAWNGSLWLVVWEDRLPNSGLMTAQVFARRVLPDGTVLDPAPIGVMPGNYPDVAAVGDVFLVVSSEEPYNHVRYIRSMRVRGSDGALLDGSVQTVGGSYSVAPSVTALGARWLVAWQRHSTHDSPYSSIRAAFVDAAGAPQGDFSVESSPTSTNRAPSLAAAGGLGSVAWSDGLDVRLRQIQADGTLLGVPSGTLLATAPNAQFTPCIASDGSGWFAAWNDYRIHPVLEAGLGDVFGTRIDAAGAVLDPGGLAVAGDPYEPEGNPSAAGDGGTSVTVFADYRVEAPFGTYRIAVRTIHKSTVGTSFCGSPSFCPCGNYPSTAGAGCANSTGKGGLLETSGSDSVTADDLVFRAAQLPPTKPALLFHGTGAPSGGTMPFGDGALCIAGQTKRYGVTFVAPNGGAAWGPGLAGQGAWSAGATLRFQAWHRDPSGPCGGGFNLTNGIEVTFTP
jgi:hypothetical protein